MFGDVVNGEMALNEYGGIVEKEWMRTCDIRPNVAIDEYMIMPNHVHGILIITPQRKGMARHAPANIQFTKP